MIMCLWLVLCSSLLLVSNFTSAKATISPSMKMARFLFRVGHLNFTWRTAPASNDTVNVKTVLGLPDVSSLTCTVFARICDLSEGCSSCDCDVKGFAAGFMTGSRHDGRYYNNSVSPVANESQCFRHPPALLKSVEDGFLGNPFAVAKKEHALHRNCSVAG